MPIRGLATSKTRLGAGLDPIERRALVTELLRRTLSATRDARSIAGTIVVTMDPAAAGMAKAHDAVGLVERAPGLNEAIVAARSVAVARGATAVLVLPADIPAVSADALDGLVEAARSAATTGAIAVAVVAVVPDRHDRGTNAFVVSPPAAIEPAFGDDSRRRHREAAAAAGAIHLELGGPLGFDVDTPADLLLAVATVGRLDG